MVPPKSAQACAKKVEHGNVPQPVQGDEVRGEKGARPDGNWVEADHPSLSRRPPPSPATRIPPRELGRRAQWDPEAKLVFLSSCVAHEK